MAARIGHCNSRIASRIRKAPIRSRTNFRNGAMTNLVIGLPPAALSAI
jgi:hypothetical protein